MPLEHTLRVADPPVQRGRGAPAVPPAVVVAVMRMACTVNAAGPVRQARPGWPVTAAGLVRWASQDGHDAGWIAGRAGAGPSCPGPSCTGPSCRRVGPRGGRTAQPGPRRAGIARMTGERRDSGRGGPAGSVAHRRSARGGQGREGHGDASGREPQAIQLPIVTSICRGFPRGGQEVPSVGREMCARLPPGDTAGHADGRQRCGVPMCCGSRRRVAGSNHLTHPGASGHPPCPIWAIYVVRNR